MTAPAEWTELGVRQRVTRVRQRLCSHAEKIDVTAYGDGGRVALCIYCLRRIPESMGVPLAPVELNTVRP